MSMYRFSFHSSFRSCFRTSFRSSFCSCSCFCSSCHPDMQLALALTALVSYFYFYYSWSSIFQLLFRKGYLTYELLTWQTYRSINSAVRYHFSKGPLKGRPHKASLKLKIENPYKSKTETHRLIKLTHRTAKSTARHPINSNRKRTKNYGSSGY